MTPTEFEHFVRQLFEARGLEGWTTERTGDDGVDAVVVNRDPLIGGLTIVQAKKYSGVLGVSHIRELVGAMDEKRAGRGILVTTSWFASGCWTKATENGRIELIDGPRLALPRKGTSVQGRPSSTASSAGTGVAPIGTVFRSVEGQPGPRACLPIDTGEPGEGVLGRHPPDAPMGQRGVAEPVLRRGGLARCRTIQAVGLYEPGTSRRIPKSV
jgi:hypothetical protein